MSSAPASTLSPPDPSSARRLVLRAALVATMGALAYGYDTGVISGALPFMTEPPAQGGLGLTSFTEGLVAASLIFGAALGSIASGHFSDKYGRLATLRGLALLFMLGGLGTALAPDVPIMVVMRFILGVAVGGGSATVPVFLAEIAGPKRRGRLVSQNELMIVSGQLVAYISNAVLAYAFHTPGIWRYMLAIALIPGALLFVGTYFVPTSPRWLASKGRIDEAREMLAKIRSNPEDVDQEMEEMTAQPTAKAGSWGDIFREPWTRKLLAIGIGLGFVLQFTGVNAFMYYTPIILKSTGLGTNAAITATIGNGVVSVLATFVGIWGVGKFGRRSLLMTGLCFVVLAQIGLGAVLQFVPAGLVQSYMALGCILLFLLFMQMFVSPVYWLLMSELFPQNLRGLMTGLAVSVQWIFNAIVAFAFPMTLDVMGNNTFFLFAAINVASFIFVLTCLPETKGKSLEEIEQHLEEELTVSPA